MIAEFGWPSPRAIDWDADTVIRPALTASRLGEARPGWLSLFARGGIERARTRRLDNQGTRAHGGEHLLLRRASRELEQVLHRAVTRATSEPVAAQFWSRSERELTRDCCTCGADYAVRSGLEPAEFEKFGVAECAERGNVDDENTEFVDGRAILLEEIGGC